MEELSEFIKTNKYQTSLTEGLRSSLHKEVWNDLIEFIDSVKFINWLIQPENVRGFAKDRPKETEFYNDGRISVDITKPHILENMDFFRERALFFEKHGRYTHLRPNSNPKSEFAQFWKEELRRWKYGLVRESDGEWIPGGFYFYLNYSPIWVNKALSNNTGKKVKGDRKKHFPNVWLGDYLFFHYLDQAKNNGAHAKMLKTRGIGAEQPHSEIVKTFYGDKKVGDVVVGDKLIGIDGKETTVIDIYPQGDRDVYEVELLDKRKIRCGIDHLWYVNDLTVKRVRAVKLSEMIEKGLTWSINKGRNVAYKYKIPKLNTVEYPDVNLPIDPYVLGALLGDGALTGNNIRIATNDEFIIEEFSRRLPNYSFSRDKTNNNYLIVDNNRFSKNEYNNQYENSKYGINKLKRDIKCLNLDVATGEKFIPEIYLRSGFNQRLELLQGLMDTDGSINANGMMEFSNSNYELIQNVASLCRSLGIKATIGFGRPPRKKMFGDKECDIKQEYRIYINTNLVIFKLPRKVNRCRDKKLFDEYPIVSIKKLGYKEKSSCFLVDNETHTYLTGDYVPTHNSYKLASLSPRNMYIEPGLPNFHLASDKSFLDGEKGVYGKVLDVLDWIADSTPLPKMRLINSPRSREVQLGYADEYGVKKGLKSSVYGISLKDNPDKARGVRGPLIHYEEDGLFPNLEKAWSVNRKAVEDGDIVYGQMCALGCVCAGTKVWTNDGRYINIEDLKQDDGIIGFDVDNERLERQTISWMQPPAEKECVEIKTAKRTLKCSNDHPILTRSAIYYNTDEIIGTRKDYYKKLDKWYETPKYKTKCEYIKKWKLAGDIKPSDIILVSEGIDIWGNEELFDARLVGMLIGDGSYGMRKHYDKIEYKTPSFSNCDEECLKYIFDRYQYNIELQRPTKDGRLYHEISIRGLVPKLKEIGIAGQSKDKKRLPVNFMNLTKNDSALLLAGLFDTDGYIRFTKKRSPNSVSITQSSFEMLEQIKILLEKFGITSTIRKNEPRIAPDRKDKNPWFTLCIQDKKSLINFADNIPLIIKYKVNNLNNIKQYETENNWRVNNTFDNIIEEMVVEVNNIGNQLIYNLTAKENNTYLANGIITHNTGGTEGADFEGSEKLFRNPLAYNIYGIPNVFDKNSNGESLCGFFWGAYLNRSRCYDEINGEPDVVKALVEILNDRFVVKYNSSDPSVITQKLAEEPITPSEAVMRTSGTIFPVADLKDYRDSVRIQGQRYFDAHYVGELIATNKGIEWKPSNDVYPIRRFPTGTDKPEGAIEIFEMPKTDHNGKIDPNRYIAGIDPIDDDHSGTDSLASIMIMDLYTDRIVAEFTGRPKFANDFYEICRRMLLFYNAKANYENDKKGLFAYFDQKRCLHLLCETPQILRDMEYVKVATFGNKSRGTNSGKMINAWGRRLQKDWMQSVATAQDYDENGEQIGVKLNMHTIRGIAYVEELIAWNPDINADRVSCAGMLMIYREDRLKYLTKGSSNKDEDDDDGFLGEYGKNFENAYDSQISYEKWQVDF